MDPLKVYRMGLLCKAFRTMVARQRRPNISIVRHISTGFERMSNAVQNPEKQASPQRPEMTTGWHTTRTQVEELIELYRNTPEDPKVEKRRRKHLAWTVFTCLAAYGSAVVFWGSLYLYFAYFPI